MAYQNPFFRGIYNLLIGLKVTIKHLFRHAITLQYPTERWEMPERSRGMVVLLSDKETGELNCTACMLCHRSCPTAAIRVERHRGEDKKWKLDAFTLDHTICCYCGLCEEACKFDALKLVPKYEYSSSDKDDLVFDVHRLQEWGLDVDYTPTRPRKKKEAQAGEKTEAATDTKPTASQEEKPAEAKPQAAAADSDQKSAPAVADTDKPGKSEPDDGDQQKPGGEQ